MLRCPGALLSHLLSMQPNSVPKDISMEPKAPQSTVRKLLM